VLNNDLVVFQKHKVVTKYSIGFRKEMLYLWGKHGVLYQQPLSSNQRSTDYCSTFSTKNTLVELIAMAVSKDARSEGFKLSTYI
jgi:hypothetical protein